MNWKKFLGWLLVVLCLSEAAMSVWDAAFTYNKMGPFAVIISLALFFVGAFLIQSAAKDAAGVCGLKEGKRPKMLEEKAAFGESVRQREAAPRASGRI